MDCKTLYLEVQMQLRVNGSHSRLYVYMMLMIQSTVEKTFAHQIVTFVSLFFKNRFMMEGNGCYVSNVE